MACRSHFELQAAGAPPVSICQHCQVAEDVDSVEAYSPGAVDETPSEHLEIWVMKPGVLSSSRAATI